MFSFINRLFKMLTDLVIILETNINSVQQLSDVGNDIAKAYRTEQALINKQRLEAIERGENPDQED